MWLIQSERLGFRKWTSADFALARRIWGDPEVMALLDVRGGLPDDVVTQKLSDEIERERVHGVQYWPLFERASGEFVGCCGLKPWKHSPREGWELGFYLIKEKWGKGYAFEAAQAAILAAHDRALAPILAGHHPANENSKKVLLRLGFAFLENVHFKPTGLMHPSYLLRRV